MQTNITNTELTEPAPRALALNFKHDGFNFRQVGRGESWAIYEQTKGDMRPRYEAILIRVEPPQRYASGHEAPMREVYPKSEDWGTLGWTYVTLEEARARIQAELAASGTDQN